MSEGKMLCSLMAATAWLAFTWNSEVRYLVSSYDVIASGKLGVQKNKNGSAVATSLMMLLKILKNKNFHTEGTNYVRLSRYGYGYGG